MRAIAKWGLTVLATALAGPALSEGLADGNYDVALETAGGDQVLVASLEVVAGSYEVVMTEGPFSDHFLSMRPFKCVAGPDKHWCHVPYPYPIERDVSKDLTDLEYDFLFLWKGAAEYGINMWNGVYYDIGTDGGQVIGTIHEMDMNVLSAPPEEGNLRPIRPADIEPGDPDSHWLPKLVFSQRP